MWSFFQLVSKNICNKVITKQLQEKYHNSQIFDFAQI